jgi:hypothetical protein
MPHASVPSTATASARTGQHRAHPTQAPPVEQTDDRTQDEGEQRRHGERDQEAAPGTQRGHHHHDAADEEERAQPARSVAIHGEQRRRLQGCCHGLVGPTRKRFSYGVASGLPAAPTFVYTCPDYPGTMRTDLPSPNHRISGLVDVLDRVLDKGLAVAGDIRISLAEVELLTIRIRLIICSIDKAQEIGLDWWKYDRHLAPGRHGGSNTDDLKKELRHLERQVALLASRLNSGTTTRRARSRRGNES